VVVITLHNTNVRINT